MNVIKFDVQFPLRSRPREEIRDPSSRATGCYQHSFDLKREVELYMEKEDDQGEEK